MAAAPAGEWMVFADRARRKNANRPLHILVTDSGFAGRPTDGKGVVEGSFSAQSDESGGTSITYPPPANMVSHTHDTFLFAPNLGEQTTTKFNVHNNTIDAPQSEFTQLAELLSQAHQDAANLPHAASDPMHDAAMLSAQHAHHFLV